MKRLRNTSTIRTLLAMLFLALMLIACGTTEPGPGDNGENGPDDPPPVPGAPAAPKQVSASVSESGIRVSWSIDEEDDASIETFILYRRVSGELDFDELTQKEASSTTYLDADVTPGDSYRYAVAARNEHGTSDLTLHTGPAVTAIPTEESPDLATALRRLGISGVDNPGARVDADGNPISEDFSPLGTTAEFGRREEIAMIGIDTPPHDGGEVKDLSIFGQDLDGDELYELHFETDANFPDTDTPDVHWSQSRRAVARGDLDGDGRHEVAILFLTPDDELELHLVDDKEAGFTRTVYTLGTFTGAQDVNAVAGDFSGDGIAELAVAIAFESEVELMFLSEHDNDFSVRSGLTMTFEGVLDFDGSIHLSTDLAAGNVNRDAKDALALVLNENAYAMLTSGVDGDAISHYWLIGDPLGDQEILKHERVGLEHQGERYYAVTAGVDLGDIDGDGLDELVIAGIGRFDCRQDNVASGHDFMFLAFDDQLNEFASLGTRFDRIDAPGSRCNDSGYSRMLGTMPVNVFDYRSYNFLTEDEMNDVDWQPPEEWDWDGDTDLRDPQLFKRTPAKEVQAGPFVFGNWDEYAQDPWTLETTIPLFVRADGTEANPRLRVTRENFDLTVADVDGIGRDQIVFYVEEREGGDPLAWVTFYGRGDSPAGIMARSQGHSNPLLMAAGMNNDSPVYRYKQGSHEVGFIEPVIIAALAAPPCYDDPDIQAIGACTTTLGFTQDFQQGQETTVTSGRSLHYGLGLEGSIPKIGIPLGISAEREVSHFRSFTLGEAYEFSQTVSFSSGALEDIVVFSTIPYDRYTYVTVSHPEASKVGDEIVVSLPRSPIITHASRAFYNRVMVEEGIKVDEQVLAHTPGDPSSYPRLADMSGLPGLVSSTLISVPEGSGSNTVSLSVNQIVTERDTQGVDYTTTVSATAGPAMGGFSVSEGRESHVEIVRGEGEIYEGTVGAIRGVDSDEFGRLSYSFRLAAYEYYTGNSANDPSFLVLNYFVDELGTP